MAAMLGWGGSFRRLFTTAAVAMAPRVLVICGPSGVGKSTLLKRLMADYPAIFGFSVSHTTRGPRPGEVDGKDYHFTDVDTFISEQQKGCFLETAEFSGNHYGTSSKSLQTVLCAGRWCILDIETQGVRQVKQCTALTTTPSEGPLYVFIKPPSVEHLKARLVGRNTDSDDAISRRLQKAAEEIEYGTAEGNFDIIIVNDDLDQAYTRLRDALDPLIKPTTTSES